MSRPTPEELEDEWRDDMLEQLKAIRRLLHASLRLEVSKLHGRQTDSAAAITGALEALEED